MSNQSDEKMVVRTSVLHSAHLEMQRQQKLKEEGRFKYTCRDPEMSHPERLAVLMEEVGEVARAILEGGKFANDTHNVNLRKELIQVAAVALSWAEGMDERDAQLAFPDIDPKTGLYRTCPSCNLILVEGENPCGSCGCQFEFPFAGLTDTSPPTDRGVTGQVFADMLFNDLPHFADPSREVEWAGARNSIYDAAQRMRDSLTDKEREILDGRLASPPADESANINTIRALVQRNDQMEEKHMYRQRAYCAARQLETLATVARKKKFPISHVVMCACLANQGYLCDTCYGAVFDRV